MSDKKPFYKQKKWWPVFAIAIIVFYFIGVANEKAEEEEIAEEEQTKAKEKEGQENKNKKLAEKEEAKKEKEEKEKEKEEDEVDEVDEEPEEKENPIKESFESGELTLVFAPDTLWSENSLMRVVHDMFKEVKKGFDDEKVESVLVMIDVVMTDEKGKEDEKPVITYRYTREVFKEINYDNFIDMSASEEWRILNEADSYFIHPGIRSNLKDKYTQNLR